MEIFLAIGQKCVQITGHHPDIGEFRRQIGSNDTDLDDSSISLARFNLQLGSENIDLGDIHPDLRRCDLHLVDLHTEHCPINPDLADFRIEFLNARDQLADLRVECGQFQDDVGHFNLEIGHFSLEVGHFNLELGDMQEKNQVRSVRKDGLWGGLVPSAGGRLFSEVARCTQNRTHEDAMSPDPTFSNAYEDAERASAYAQLEFAGTYCLAFRDLPGLFEAHVQGTRALDFGCGAGRSTRFLKRLGFQTVGVDISPAMLELARSVDPDGDYRLITDDNTLAGLPGPFDLILAAYPFDNIPTDAAS